MHLLYKNNYHIFLIAFVFILFALPSNANSKTYEISGGKTIQVNLGISDDTSKIQIIISPIKVNSNMQQYLTVLKQNIDYLQVKKTNSSFSFLTGQAVTNRFEYISDPYFICPAKPGDTFVISVSSNEQLILPIKVQSKKSFNQTKFQRTTLSGIFIGILIALILYNFILWLFLKDLTYLYYILYLTFIGFAQLDILGFNYYIFNNYPRLNSVMMHYCSGLSGIFGVLFIQRFLNTNYHTKGFHLFLNIILLLYALVLIFTTLKFDIIAYQLIQLAGISLPAILVLGVTIYKKGRKEGLYVVLSYLIFFVGIVFYLLKDFEIIPYNNFSIFTLPLGVALQAILLSIALANRINILNTEKESANDRAFLEIQKNEELIRNQNAELEKQVGLRTKELQEALDNLKSAQAQLVQSEKMASLGVLTAGIAHEINNPINFVSANIVPLRENIQTLSNILSAYKGISSENIQQELPKILELEKEVELDYVLNETKDLIKGIEEGASRTHTIVEGLTAFSRGDSDNMASADINEGINSTLLVLKSKLKGIKVIKDYSEIPKLNCQIGKLNQVFLNLINNAVDALEEKEFTSDRPSIHITTKVQESNIIVSFEDNANGISPINKTKIMEPFFTTKNVGKGTGLGLSISYGIIKEHNGSFEINSELNKGSRFTIKLPLN